MHVAALLTRPMTLGARVLVSDAAGRVLLIEHSYIAGWYLPGGGADPGETLYQAARRELREETGIAAPGLDLFGVYHNSKASRRDHVALFLARDWAHESDPRIPNREITRIGFFARDALPDGTTPSTLRRLDEVFGGAAPSEIW